MHYYLLFLSKTTYMMIESRIKILQKKPKSLKIKYIIYSSSVILILCYGIWHIWNSFKILKVNLSKLKTNRLNGRLFDNTFLKNV